MIPIVLGLVVVGYLLSQAARVDPTSQQSPEEIAAAARAREEAERRAREEKSAKDAKAVVDTVIGGVSAAVPLVTPIVVKLIADAGAAGGAAGGGIAGGAAGGGAASGAGAGSGAVAGGVKAGVEIAKTAADISKTAASGFANLGFAIYGGVLAVYVIAMTILSAVCERRSEWVASMRELYEQYWPLHVMENTVAQDWLSQNKIPFKVVSYKDDRLTIPLTVRGYQTVGTRNKIVPVLGSKGRDGNVLTSQSWLKLQLLARSAALEYVKNRLEAGDRVYRYFYPNVVFNEVVKLDVDALSRFPLVGGDTVAEADPEKIYLDQNAPELTGAYASLARVAKGDENLNRIMRLKGRFAALGTLRKNPTIYLEADLKKIRSELFNLIFGDVNGVTIDTKFDLICFPQDTFGLPSVPHPLAGLPIPNQVMPPNRNGNWDGYISLAEVMAGRGGVTGALAGAGLG